MFETLEARRLLSTVVTFSDGVVATQSGSGSLSVKAGSNILMNTTVLENGISQVNGGVQIGQGNVVVLEYNADTGQYEEADFYNVNATKPVTIQGSSNMQATIAFDGTSLRANIIGSSANDSISYIDRANGGTVVNAGKGNDTITCVFSHHSTISGGSGDDLIVINSSCQYDCTIADPAAGDLIVVNAGNGNDTIVVYDGTIKVDGGGGFDSMILDPAQNPDASITVVQAKNVESINTI